jgi:hypothetical protein
LARKCIFGNQKGGSAEHVSPDWLNKVLPIEEIGSVTAQAVVVEHTVSFEGTTIRSYTGGAAASLTVKDVCHDCNTGWMQRLENEARPMMSPMITGGVKLLDQRPARTRHFIPQPPRNDPIADRHVSP